MSAVISKCFAKQPQVHWSRRGAHLFLETLAMILDGSLHATFEHWFSGLLCGNDGSGRRAAAYPASSARTAGGMTAVCRVANAVPA